MDWSPATKWCNTVLYCVIEGDGYRRRGVSVIVAVCPVLYSRLSTKISTKPVTYIEWGGGGGCFGGPVRKKKTSIKKLTPFTSLQLTFTSCGGQKPAVQESRTASHSLRGLDFILMGAGGAMDGGLCSDFRGAFI